MDTAGCLGCEEEGVVPGCLLSVICCPLSVVCCLLSVVCCLLSVVCCLLSVVCCLLSVVFCGFGSFILDLLKYELNLW